MAATMMRSCQRRRPRRPRAAPRLLAAALALVASSCLLLPTADAFAAWFVDRKVSCFTDLAPDEIVMNAGILAHSASREPDIHLEVSPLRDFDPGRAGSEYVVKFLVPDDVHKRVPDIQYVLELSSGSSDVDPPAKFTAPPPEGGIGCEGRRTHGKVGHDEAAAMFTINDDASHLSRLEVTAGWATGHEAVTLTQKVVLVVGQGLITDDVLDDALEDDEAEAELEESFIEEEREELEEEIEEAEEDAIEALEEKRIESDGKDADEINEAEEDIVEALEENRKHVNMALNSLKDEILLKQAEKEQDMAEKGEAHKHKLAERREAERKHREQHDRKQHMEGRLEEMRRRFDKEGDARKDKLDKLMDMKGALRDNVDKLQRLDDREHGEAVRKHIKPLPKEELRVDMEELKHKAKEKMQLLSDKLGVNEMMNDPRMKKIRKGLIRGGEGTFHGDKGRPLPPEGRHFLFVMFALFGLVGLVRWQLDKRRRARKGRRTL